MKLAGKQEGSICVMGKDVSIGTLNDESEICEVLELGVYEIVTDEFALVK